MNEREINTQKNPFAFMKGEKIIYNFFLFCFSITIYSRLFDENSSWEELAILLLNISEKLYFLCLCFIFFFFIFPNKRYSMNFNIFHKDHGHRFK